MNIRLGEKYRDRLTGFTGTATARTDFLYGCVRICLEGSGSDGKPEDYWFDEQRLEAVVDGVPVPVEATATSGGARPDAPRTGLRG